MVRGANAVFDRLTNILPQAMVGSEIGSAGQWLTVNNHAWNREGLSGIAV